jgi:hypothetical protein
MLSFCDNKYFPLSWKDDTLSYLSMDLKSFYIQSTQGEVIDSDGQVNHRSDLNELLSMSTTVKNCKLKKIGPVPSLSHSFPTTKLKNRASHTNIVWTFSSTRNIPVSVFVFISTQTNVYTHTGSRFQNVQNYSYFLDYCVKSVSSLSRSLFLPSDSLPLQKNKINQLTTSSSCYRFFFPTISKGGVFTHFKNVE